MNASLMPKQQDMIGGKALDFPTNPSPTDLNTLTMALTTPKFGTLIPNRIFVGGLPSNTVEQELKNYFSSFGQVKDVKIINDRSGLSKGLYGFVTFENPEVADSIIKNESETLIFKDRKLNIGHAIRKQPLFSPRPDAPGNTVYLTNSALPYSFPQGVTMLSLPGQELLMSQMAPSFPTAAVVMSQPMFLPQQPFTYMPGPGTPGLSSGNWTEAVSLPQCGNVNNNAITSNSSNQNNNTMPLSMSNTFMAPGGGQFSCAPVGPSPMNVAMPPGWRWAPTGPQLAYGAPGNPYEATFTAPMGQEVGAGTTLMPGDFQRIPNELFALSSINTMNNSLEQRLPHSAKRIRLTDSFDGLIL